MNTRSTFVEGLADGPSEASEGPNLIVMAPDSFSIFPLPKSGTVLVGRSSTAEVRLDDLRASREHLRIHVSDQMLVEDLQSANGTRVRDEVVPRGGMLPVGFGEAIVVGATILIVQQGPGVALSGARRLWAHGHFERLLENERQRARESGRRLSLARVQLQRPLSWSLFAPVLAREVPAPHVFAAYAPHDYELLLLDVDESEAEHLVQRVSAALAELNVPTRSGLVFFPKDGNTAQEMLARADELVRPGRRGTARAVSPPEHPESEIARLYETATRAAGRDVGVLILGETGAGKEVLARYIHQSSKRARETFMAINCGALPESLVEAELFGFKQGAFSGATQVKPGLLEAANGGTVFLDEIGDLPLTAQVKLLRVLETREVTRVGEVKPRTIDVRFVAATHHDLEHDVQTGKFRRDLYYRLNLLTLTIPPLRKRPLDILPLARAFAEAECATSDRQVPEFPEDVVDLLEGYDWPGNIRELKNVVIRALVLCGDDRLSTEHFPLDKMAPEDPTAIVDIDPPGDATDHSVDPASIRRRIIAALAASGGNQTRAAKALGISRRTLLKKLDRFEIPRPQKRPQ